MYVSLLLCLIPAAFADPAPGVLISNLTNSSREAQNSSKEVFAHYMLCFAAFGGFGNRTGYKREMALAQGQGLDGFGLEYLGRDSYYLPNIDNFFAACEEYNAALPPGSRPFKLFPIINFCCGLNVTDAAFLHQRFANSSCRHHVDNRPVFSTWAGINSRLSFQSQAAIWEEGFFKPIQNAGLKRPFFLPFIYPANYTNAETPNLAQQRGIIAGMGATIDGLWYWGCAPLADKVAASSSVTVQACREAGKYVATPVSGPYSPHHKGNNRYSTSAGARAVIETWMEHIASQPDMVIFTTWNDLGEHHYVGPYNLDPHSTFDWEPFPHLAYLELSAYFIAWFKQPPSSPAPAVVDEKLFWFYNLQPVNNSCPGDPLGPGSINTDAAFMADTEEDMLYATLLLDKPAQIELTSGNTGNVNATGNVRRQRPCRSTGNATTGAGASTFTFSVGAGVQSVKVPLKPGRQMIIVRRDGVVLASVTGGGHVNASNAALCNKQTFTGVQQLLGTEDRSDSDPSMRLPLAAMLIPGSSFSASSSAPARGSYLNESRSQHLQHRYHRPRPWPERTWP